VVLLRTRPEVFDLEALRTEVAVVEE